MNTEIGSHIVIRIIGDPRLYVAEVTKESPLTLKITEQGFGSDLTEDMFIIEEEKTKAAQGTQEEQQKLLQEMVDRGHPLASGLISLGITDEKIRELLPL